MRVLTRFITSASDASRFPAPGLPEVAFLGRSNVSESSVIIRWWARKSPKTSNTPGRTQRLTSSRSDGRASRKRNHLCRSAGLRRRQNFRAKFQVNGRALSIHICISALTWALCLALVDISIPPQASERQLLDFRSGTRISCCRHEERPRLGKSIACGEKRPTPRNFRKPDHSVFGAQWRGPG